VDTAEKQLMGHAFQLARALRMGEGSGQEDKVRENLRSEHVKIPDLTVKIKDHKEMKEGEPVKVRPVCGAQESPNGQLSNVLSDVLNALTKFEDKHNTECRSSEEMRAGIKEVNAERPEGGPEDGASPPWRLDGERVIGSTDFKAYYPSIPVGRTAKIVAKMAEDSELNIKTDNTEMALYLASTMKREEIVRLGLGEVVQERLHSSGAAPGITSREILSRGPACKRLWREPARPPTEQERRQMLGIMLELAINACMENHYYTVDNEVKLQRQGAGIGLRLSEALGRAFGLYWDDQLIQKLEKLDWSPEMIKRYVDDLNAVVVALAPGTRYNALEEKLEVVAALVESDGERMTDDITMSVFGDIANTLDPDIDVEIDFPSNHADNMMPILDMKMAMDGNNRVVYKFYRKPMANKHTMMARSALSDRVKRSTMTNDALRRLLCCSPNLDASSRQEVMEDYARMLRRSGYSERFRHEVITDAVRGFEKMLKAEEEGGRPVDRPRDYQEASRRRAKEDKRGRYYRKEKRGTRVREGVIIIPPTPDSVLAKELKKICQEELKGTNISLAIQERGGRRLGQALGTTVPGRGERRHCQREKCFACNSGQEGVCRKTGLGYEITCNVCQSNNNIISKYAGETGKNLYMRGTDYVRDVDKKLADKPLWKHVIEKHGGRMEVPMFQHFTMSLTQHFTFPQRRKANEGVRIAHLDPDTRLNSKDEFRQGTNIAMRPARGVGVAGR
jgi:hypothetical protein